MCQITSLDTLQSNWRHPLGVHGYRRIWKRFRFGGANWTWSTWGLYLDGDPPNYVEPTPIQATANWLIFLSGCVLSGLAFLIIEPFLISSTGSFGPTILQSAHPAAAIFSMGLALLVVFVISAGAGRLLKSPSKGLVVFGIGLGWLAWRLEGVEVIAFSGSMSTVAIEGLVWTLIVLLASYGIYLVSGPLASVHPREATNVFDHWATSRASAIFVASGLCAIPIVWLFAQSPARGQVVAAAAIGSIAAGMVGRLLAPHAQPVLLMMSPILAGTLVQWTMVFWLPQSELGTMFMQGDFPHVLLPVPIDWAAGSLMGVPWGIYFGNMFLQHDDGSQSPQTA
ncbi:MAG: hypothetical protein CMJ29_07130 [Phycisphaerae bacterium]|nr:hypothetical protein [Phycisphaerae bacterium]